MTKITIINQSSLQMVMTVKDGMTVVELIGPDDAPPPSGGGGGGLHSGEFIDLVSGCPPVRVQR